MLTIPNKELYLKREKDSGFFMYDLAQSRAKATDRYLSHTRNVPFYLEDIMPKGICSNTGRTHFKKGFTPWNKGIKVKLTKKAKLANKKRKGISMPKPLGFSDTMRKVNPPKGKKIRYANSLGHNDKKLRVWRKGYVHIYLPEHPTSRKSPPDYGYITEHRFVMEKFLGRDIKKGEIIHHIDGDKSNNKIENLLLCIDNKEHNRVHTAMEIFVEELIREERVYYDKENKRFSFR